MTYSRDHLSEIAEYAARWEPFSFYFLKEYFETLRFDFGKDYQEGLLFFYKLAAELEELKAVPELEFMDFSSEVRT
jgi:predicted solute-binding protein